MSEGNTRHHYRFVPYRQTGKQIMVIVGAESHLGWQLTTEPIPSPPHTPSLSPTPRPPPPSFLPKQRVQYLHTKWAISVMPASWFN